MACAHSHTVLKNNRVEYIFKEEKMTTHHLSLIPDFEEGSFWDFAIQSDPNCQYLCLPFITLETPSLLLFLIHLTLLCTYAFSSFFSCLGFVELPVSLCTYTMQSTFLLPLFIHCPVLHNTFSHLFFYVSFRDYNYVYLSFIYLLMLEIIPQFTDFLF